MAAEPLDIGMARLEGAYAQINERLAALENRFATEMAGLRTELSDLRKQMASQFYWVLTLLLGSILIPLLRDVLR
jgi:hypothetical protein